VLASQEGLCPIWLVGWLVGWLVSCAKRSKTQRLWCELQSSEVHFSP